MKKYLFMIVVACVALACSKDNIQNDATPDNVQDAKGNISFMVDVESVSDVKATISASDNFTWEDSDCAAVYTSEGTKVELTPSDISGGVATFTGEVPSGETVAEGAIVVYPAAFLTAANTVTFPATYATNGQGTVLAAKVASGRKLTFKYLAATLKATITDVPSIATSITVTSTQTLTGEHTIDFSGSTPTLSTSSTAKEITFSSPANGNNELIIPVPKTGASQTFTYKVNYSSNVLFTKSTTKALERNSYMSMASLTINPKVYLKSNMTDWDVADSGWEMGNSGSTYSTNINSIGTQYATVYVKYPAASIMKMGPDSDRTTATSVEFKPEKDTAVKLTDRGAYTITFDPTTATFTYTKTSSELSFYLVGSENSWDITDKSFPLTNKTSDGKFYLIGQKGKFKIRYNESWGSTIGDPGNSADSQNFGSGDAVSSSLIINIPSNGNAPSFDFFDESYSSTKEYASVRMHDEITTANYYDMEVDSYNPNLWTKEMTFPDPNSWGGTKIKFNLDSAWWGTDESLSGVEYNGISASKDSVSDCFWVPNVKALVVLNSKTEKIKFISL